MREWKTHPDPPEEEDEPRTEIIIDNGVPKEEVPPPVTKSGVWKILEDLRKRRKERKRPQA